MPTWEDFAIRLPDRTFETSLQLNELHISHVGGKHAPDSAVVVVPDSSVMLVGDCYFPPPYHLREEGDGIDFALAKRLLAERHSWYVDAHSPPRGPGSET